MCAFIPALLQLFLRTLKVVAPGIKTLLKIFARLLPLALQRFIVMQLSLQVFVVVTRVSVWIFQVTVKLLTLTFGFLQLGLSCM